jgi:DNA integrity scanning protein DisA with diadenylate cyclase activity
MKYLNEVIFESALNIAKKVKAKAVLFRADIFDNLKPLEELSGEIEVILIAKTAESFEEANKMTKNVIHLPYPELTRLGQIKVAVLVGLSSGILSQKDKIVCLSGLPRSNFFDTILVLDIGKEVEIFTSSALLGAAENVKPEVFEAVLKLALELATQGREGKAVGTIFVLGDHKKVLQLSRQLLINPFKGYPEEEINILSADIGETIKEFSSIDGAFIIREDGVVVTAGRHLSAALEDKDFPAGLGSRHVAAAGITSLTGAIAIVISESSHTVRIFKGGKLFMEIERP